MALLQRSVINCILGNVRVRRNGSFPPQTYNIFEKRYAKPRSTQSKMVATSYIWLLNETKNFLGHTSHISSAPQPHLESGYGKDSAIQNISNHYSSLKGKSKSHFLHEKFPSNSTFD